MSHQLTIAHAIARHELDERDRGMELAASRNADLLHLARGLAYLHASAYGTVTIEDVRRELDRRIPGWPVGNWMGSVFREKRWQWTGRMIQTKHKGSHARAVREWRLR